jgi:hypothetical protein
LFNSIPLIYLLGKGNYNNRSQNQTGLLRKVPNSTSIPSAPKPLNLKSKKAEAGTVTQQTGSIVKGSHWGGGSTEPSSYVTYSIFSAVLILAEIRKQKL